MENIDIESFSSVKEIDPKQEKLNQTIHRTKYVLSLGVVIGLGLQLSIIGIFQTLSRHLYSHPVYGKLLRLWFRVEWWMWVPFIIVFCAAFYGARRWISNVKD